MLVNYISLEEQVAKVYRDLGYRDIEEDTIIEQIGEALVLVGTPKSMEEGVCFLEIMNNRCLVPNGCKQLIQIARHMLFNQTKFGAKHPALPNNYYTTDALDLVAKQQSDKLAALCCPEKVLEVAERANTGTCRDCDGGVINDSEIAYYRPYFDLVWEFEMWRNSSWYGQVWEPVRLSNHSFFNSVVCREHDHDTLYDGCGIEYSVNWPYLYFSFECGFVAIAYRRLKVDEKTGYPFIPGNEETKKAISSYCRMMKRIKDYDLKPRMGVSVAAANVQWELDALRAISFNKSLVSIDEERNFTERSTYMIPRDDYRGFFGYLGRKRLPGRMEGGGHQRVTRSNAFGGTVIV